MLFSYLAYGEGDMRIFLMLLMLSFACPAFARTQCTTEPKDKWMSQTDMKAQIAIAGYKPDVFKVTKGNCYEIYGRDAKGKRIEVYFNPVNGKVVPKTSE
jgi:hypothetical protein